MTLVQRIQEDFKAAFKAGEKEKKDCLGMIKTKLTEWEKKNPGKELTDQDVLGVVVAEIKKRKDSVDLYLKADNPAGYENAKKENREIDILQVYLPKQMTDDEIRSIVVGLKAEANGKPLIAVANQYFSKHFKGQYDSAVLKSIIDQVA